MKIIVLMGSPNRNGSTDILVERFKKGAEETGHAVEVIDVCHADIHPCTGCVACGYLLRFVIPGVPHPNPSTMPQSLKLM